jgi:hypothetical protein
VHSVGPCFRNEMKVRRGREVQKVGDCGCEAADMQGITYMQDGPMVRRSLESFRSCVSVKIESLKGNDEEILVC